MSHEIDPEKMDKRARFALAKARIELRRKTGCTANEARLALAVAGGLGPALDLLAAGNPIDRIAAAIAQDDALANRLLEPLYKHTSQEVAELARVTGWSTDDARVALLENEGQFKEARAEAQHRDARKQNKPG